MDPISRELREYVGTTTRELLEIADHIDAEFEWRTGDKKQQMSEGAKRIFDRMVELSNEESMFERLKKAERRGERLRVITAQEALRDYARYALVDVDGKTCGLYRAIEQAENAARQLNMPYECPRYEVAVIAS